MPPTGIGRIFSPGTCTAPDRPHALAFATVLRPRFAAAADLRVTGDGAARRGWWADYFDETFLDVYGDLLPEDEAAEEAAAAMEALGLKPAAHVLDLACGWGRHSLALARLGFRVTAIDLSTTLLSGAVTRSREAGLPIEWIRGDIRALPFGRQFDAVLCLFSSLGYFPSDDDDLRVLREVCRVLAPGGRLLLETMHRDLLAREFVERDWWEGPDGSPVLVEREFDAVAGVSREWLRWRGREKYHEIRVRSAPEWARLLDLAGLEAESWLGDWELSPFEHTSERLIVVAAPRLQ